MNTIGEVNRAPKPDIQATLTLFDTLPITTSRQCAALQSTKLSRSISFVDQSYPKL